MSGLSVSKGMILGTLIQAATMGALALALLLQAVATGRASELIEGLTRYATRDHAGAIEVLRPLADQGDAVAEEILGKIHLTGEGTTRDSIAAFKRFLQAAERGRADAQLQLGRMYRDGVGISADGNLAMFWFDRAAKQGAPDAYNAIGELYLGHPDVLADAAAARRFFLSGANLGHAGAMYNLGMIYLVGHGVTQDGIEAYKWFELSAQTGAGQERDIALRALSTLRERLTPVQVAMAMAAVNDWPQVTRDRPL
jgi:TPR repeat protein